MRNRLLRLPQDREIYRNIAQEAYAQKALGDAVDEVRQNFADNVFRRLKGEQVMLGEGDFAFPIFVCKAVDPRVAAIFEKEEHVALKNSAPLYFGWNYGLVCGQSAAVTGECLAMFAFMRFGYHNLRQYEGFLNREMERTSLRSRAIDTEGAASIVGNLAHTFEWFHLDFFRHLGTLNSFMHSVASELVERWRLDKSVSRMHGSLAYHRDYASAEFARAAQRDTKRQEAILFLIALLQLFALISVLVDFQSLHGITQDARKLLDPGLVEWEWWGLQHVGTVPRVILVLAIFLALAFYGPIVLRRGKNLLVNGSKGLARNLVRHVHSSWRRLRFLNKKLVIRGSAMHDVGTGFSLEVLAGAHKGLCSASRCCSVGSTCSSI